MPYGNQSRYVLLILVLFAVFCTVRHRDVIGEDLSSSYVGCRLVATGESSHLYNHDEELFNEVNDPLWEEIADSSGFSDSAQVHPYVQTPLWAYVFGPICMRLSFPQFNKIFMAMGALCFAATIWLVARYWTPSLMHPVWITLILGCLYITQPFKYALFLNQTQILFVFLTIAALILASRGHPVAAGVLLSIAAAVKITPGFLIFYWLVTRQMKAALSFALSSALLLAATVFTCGLGLTKAYLLNLTYISNVLLVPFNNQSFAAWLLAHKHPVEYFVWHIYALPVWVKILCLALTLGFAVLGGMWDRKLWRDHSGYVGWPPVGAVLTMLAATLLAPIAWTHYFVLLVVPVMFMLHSNLKQRSSALIGLMLAILALNVPPFAFQAVQEHVAKLGLVRSHFYAGILSLSGMGLLYMRERRALAVSPAKSREGTLSRLTLVPHDAVEVPSVREKRKNLREA